MPEYLSPGVYVEEVSGGEKPIEGVGTSVGGFIGIAEKGEFGKAVLVTNWSQFVDNFGSFTEDGYLAFAVYQFFAEGGRTCWVVRTCHYDEGGNPTATPASATVKGGTNATDTLEFETIAIGSWGNSLFVEIADATSKEDDRFKLIIKRGSSEDTAKVLESYDELTMGKGSADYVLDRVNDISEYITVNDPTSNGDGPRPANGTVQMAGGTNGLPVVASTILKDRHATTPENTLEVTAVSAGAGGNSLSVFIEDGTNNGFKLTVLKDGVPLENESWDDLQIITVRTTINGVSNYISVKDLGSSTTAPANNPANGTFALTDGSDYPTDADFLGTPDNRNGLHALDEVDDVNNIAIPDRPGDPEVINGALAYCEKRQDVFFVADAELDDKPSDVKNFRMNVGNFNSSYGALYWPWVNMTHPITGEVALRPPSGAVVGVYANTDNTRGVHKAPAGIVDGRLKSVVGIEYQATKGEHDQLNPEGVNVIRTFPGMGNVIWGARTLSADAEWKYINVRRLFMFLEESIEDGIQWCVFEPNDPSLWAKIRRNITAFLTRVWRDGALFGATPEEAFFVKCDEELNPPDVCAAGQVIIEVGVAPVKPAEFVIMRIQQKTLPS